MQQGLSLTSSRHPTLTDPPMLGLMCRLAQAPSHPANTVPPPAKLPHPFLYSRKTWCCSAGQCSSPLRCKGPTQVALTAPPLPLNRWRAELSLPFSTPCTNGKGGRGWFWEEGGSIRQSCLLPHSPSLLSRMLSTTLPSRL